MFRKCSIEAVQVFNANEEIQHALTYETPDIEENTQVETNTAPKLDIKRFMRRTFDVDAVQVTEENFDAVAEWCGGKIVTVKDAVSENKLDLGTFDGQTHISIDVARPLTRRQTEAYVGDWVLYANKGFKVYTNRPFVKNFVERNEELQELFVTTDTIGQANPETPS